MKITVHQASEEIKDAQVELLFASNWAIIELNHIIGAVVLLLITSSKDKFEEKVEKLSQKTNINQRNLYLDAKFVLKVPDLDLLKEDKRITWAKIVDKYLLDK